MAIKRILISQPKPVNHSPYDTLVEKFSVEIDYEKFIKVEGLDTKEFKKQKIRFLDYPAVIFTSRIAIDHFFRIAEKMRWSIPSTMIYFCINETVALYLQKYIVYRKRKIFFANSTPDSLVELILKTKKADKYLLPVAENHKNPLINKLKKNNINFTKVVLYRTVSADLSHIDLSKYDIIALFTPAGVKSLKENFPNFDFSKIKIAAFGSEAQRAVKKEGLKLEIKAPTSSAPSMVSALEEYLKKHNA